MEMLDAIIRLAITVFEGSELSALSTRKKVWYLLEQVLDTVGEIRAEEMVTNVAIFSDSEESSDDADGSNEQAVDKSK